MLQCLKFRQALLVALAGKHAGFLAVLDINVFEGRVNLAKSGQQQGVEMLEKGTAIASNITRQASAWLSADL
jgi:hypothetical protein